MTNSVACGPSGLRGDGWLSLRGAQRRSNPRVCRISPPSLGTAHSHGYLGTTLTLNSTGSPRRPRVLLAMTGKGWLSIVKGRVQKQEDRASEHLQRAIGCSLARSTHRPEHPSIRQITFNPEADGVPLMPGWLHLPERCRPVLRRTATAVLLVPPAYGNHSPPPARRKNPGA